LDLLEETSNTPTIVEMNGLIIDKMSCGDSHTLLLSRDGDIYAFGSNSFGQLGTEDQNQCERTPKKMINSQKFIDIESHYCFDISIALSKNGIFYIWGRTHEEPIIKPNSFKLIL